MHRRVRDGCGDVAEKRLLRLHTAAHKRPRLFHHRRVQIRALLQRQLAAVVHVGGGIIGVRNGLAFPAVKLIEPVVQRIRRALQVRVAQSPFTKGARAVAAALKTLATPSLFHPTRPPRRANSLAHNSAPHAVSPPGLACTTFLE